MGCFLKYGAGFLIFALLFAYFVVSSVLRLDLGAGNPFNALWFVLAAVVLLFVAGHFMMRRK